MRERINIFSKILLLTATALCVMTSCRKDAAVFDYSMEFYQGDGELVDVKLDYESPEQATVTRALSDDQERQVNDLVVMAFPVLRQDAAGNPVFNTEIPVYKHYFSQSELLGARPQDELHKNAGFVELYDMHTGSYLLLGMANVRTSEYGGEEVFEKLMAVNTWEDYKSIHAELGTAGSVDRVSPAMLMSGTYRPYEYEGDHRATNIATVTTAGKLSGYLHLIRVDARVKFVITNKIPKCKSFTVNSWQVVNVPSDVAIFHEAKSTPSACVSSNEKFSFTVSGENTSFEFYIPEYCYTSADSGLDMIKKRAKRNSDDTGWLYSPQDAPYVIIKGKAEMLVDDAETGTHDVERSASFKFLIHLGTTAEGNEATKAKDYNTDRNTKYTYNVKVNGVDDIVVEAKKETIHGEYNHLYEGTVVDNVGGIQINLDSHYALANIALSRNELKHMSALLSSVFGEQEFKRDPDGNVINDSFDVESEDFQAFRFAFEPVSSALAYKATPAQIFTAAFVSYSNTYDAGKYIRVLHNEVSQQKDSKHTSAMYDLKSMGEGLPFGDGGAQYKDSNLEAFLNAAIQDPACAYASKDDIPVIFTVFVNEYVYYNNGVNWHDFANINVPDRVLRIFSTSDVSTDKRSEYIRGKYNFTQKPCQTYYSSENDEALCVEYVNEHHHKDLKNTMGANTGGGGSVKSGWTYVNAALSGREWNAYSDQTVPLCSHYNAFRTYSAVNSAYAKNIPGSSDPNDYEAVPASLSRNRDLNRDGIIDSNELKWFLPSMEQYLQITIGGAALSSKLFVPDDYNNWNEAVDGPKGNIFGNVRFHFIGVEKNSKYWSEEGYTIGNQSVQNPATSSSSYNSNPWELRCVRMLVDQSRIGDEEQHWNDFDDLYYYSNRDKNVISMDKYQMNLHRQAISNGGWIPLHQNSDETANSTFTHFQYAKYDSPLIDVNAGERTLVNRMDNNLYCNTYSEASDGSDLGTWRTPNQRETAVIRYLAGLNMGTQPNGNSYYLSCSIWPFPSSSPRTYQGYQETIDFCTIGANPTKSSPGGQLGSHKLRVRCVRDTDKDGNYVGDPAYGNPANFEYGDLGCIYVDGGANISVVHTMDPAAEIVSVTINGVEASVSSTGEGHYTSSVNGAEVAGSTAEVVWIIRMNGKTIRYSNTYQLPARYWMISRIGAENRYASVNPDTDRTTVGAADSRPVDEHDAIYKWIITRNPNGTDPVNETELQTGVTYYLFNAGVEKYINGPTNTTSNGYMTVGESSPMYMKLQLRDNYDGYYVLRFRDATNANSNGGLNNFGMWNGVDDGSTYKLTPAVMRGLMPLNLKFASTFERTADGYAVNATMAEGAQVTSVTIAGQQATFTQTSATSWRASIVCEPITGDSFETCWRVSYRGGDFEKTHTYDIPRTYRASLMTFSEINAMAVGDQIRVVMANPSTTRKYFLGHNGTSPVTNTHTGYSNQSTIDNVANETAADRVCRFYLTRTSSGFTLTSEMGGFSPNRNGGGVTWQNNTANVFTLSNPNVSDGALLVSYPTNASFIRFTNNGSFLNADGPKYATGQGAWSIWYVYRVTVE